jgi:TPP-dependent 2-oxoacid decarboxylase
MFVEQLAAKEEKEPNRTILFTGKLTIVCTENSGKSLTIASLDYTGDGSLQLTVQEIGTMIRRELSPYLFVLNNDG